MPSESEMGPVEGELFRDLAERLRIAHRRVAALDADDEVKPVLTRRLIAISDAAKHDLGRASHRLDLLLTELDAHSA